MSFLLDSFFLDRIIHAFLVCLFLLIFREALVFKYFEEGSFPLFQSLAYRPMDNHFVWKDLGIVHWVQFFPAHSCVLVHVFGFSLLIYLSLSRRFRHTKPLGVLLLHLFEQSGLLLEFVPRFKAFDIIEDLLLDPLQVQDVGLFNSTNHTGWHRNVFPLSRLLICILLK